MRRILGLTLAICLLTVLACGCSAASEVTSASPTAEPKSAGDDYRSWTKSDWDRASEEEKIGAARYVLFEFGSEYLDGFDDLAKQELQTEVDRAAENVRTAIDAYFASAGTTDTLDTFIQDGENIVP